MGSITVSLVVNNDNFNEECPIMELGVLRFMGCSQTFILPGYKCPLGGSISIATAREPGGSRPQHQDVKLNQFQTQNTLFEALSADDTYPISVKSISCFISPHGTP